MNPFDLSILHFLNEFSRQHLAVDAFVSMLTDGLFFQGGLIMAVFWWGWTREDTNQTESRESLVFGLGLSILAIAFARGMALTLPFRERPLRNPLLHFQIPYDVSGTVLERWSSFPSDHAALFFCLATVLWTVSWRLGAIAYLHAFFVVMLPLMYEGLHYPSDIVVGAAIGCAIGSLVQLRHIRSSLARPLLQWCQRHVAWSYVLLFSATFECGEMFGTVRSVMHAALLVKPSFIVRIFR